MSANERIKELRLKKGWNQSELAEKLGITSGGMSLLESGKNKPSLEMVEKIAKLFNVSLDFIVTGKEEMNTISEDELLILETLREDKSIAQIVMDIAKVKKKAINYLVSYQQQHIHAA